MRLNDTLRMLRKNEDLTQGELSEKLDIKQYSISDYELGRIEPTLSALCKYADHFGVSVDFLLGRTNQNSEAEQKTLDYLSTACMDKYLIEIYEEIKNLSPKAKKQIIETIKSTKKIFLEDVSTDTCGDETSDLIRRDAESD